MVSLAKSFVVGAALLTAAQPCLAAGSNARVEVEAVRFDLARAASSTTAASSMSLAASTQTAAETPEKKQHKGISTTAIVIVGGVVLLVALLAAVAGAMPTAGPPKGAFN